MSLAPGPRRRLAPPRAEQEENEKRERPSHRPRRNPRRAHSSAQGTTAVMGGRRTAIGLSGRSHGPRVRVGDAANAIGIMSGTVRVRAQPASTLGATGEDTGLTTPPVRALRVVRRHQIGTGCACKQKNKEDEGAREGCLHGCVSITKFPRVPATHGCEPVRTPGTEAMKSQPPAS
jgi:hypothetical protein